jgi:hypothetical protein
VVGRGAGECRVRWQDTDRKEVEVKRQAEPE